MEQHGGHGRVRDNPEIALKVHAQLEGHKATSVAPIYGKYGDGHTRASAAARDEPKFDRKELLELQRPLNKVLADSLPYYESKLLAQMEVIKDEINKSTQQIIARLEAGSHDKVTHPDVRYVWKDMVSFRVISKSRQDFKRSSVPFLGVAILGRRESLCLGSA